MKTLEMFDKMDAYLGYIKDKRILKCASGGIAFALYKTIIAEGGIVFGVSYSEDYKSAEWRYAVSEDELCHMCGSKYIETNKFVQVGENNILVWKVVADFLSEGRKVLFIGLGCDIAALKKYLNTKHITENNLFTIDLICHGPAKSMLQKIYIEDLEKKYHSKINFFSVKYKKDKWNPSYIMAKFDNGKKHLEKFECSDYRYAFDNYCKKPCFECQFKGLNHVSDMTIGDYWGMTEDMQGYNKLGCSVLFVHSDKGNKLIECLKKGHNVYVERTDTIYALENNPMYYMSRRKNESFDEKIFEENLTLYGLHKAVILSMGKKKYIYKKIKEKIAILIPYKIRKKLYSMRVEKKR